MPRPCDWSRASRQKSLQRMQGPGWLATGASLARQRQHATTWKSSECCLSCRRVQMFALMTCTACITQAPCYTDFVCEATLQTGWRCSESYEEGSISTGSDLPMLSCRGLEGWLQRSSWATKLSKALLLAEDATSRPCWLSALPRRSVAWPSLKSTTWNVG